MHNLNDITLESNKYLKINFNGGDLSSDAGLLLFKEFLFKLGAVELFQPYGCRYTGTTESDHP
jgi:hypothetical protein